MDADAFAVTLAVILCLSFLFVFAIFFIISVLRNKMIFTLGTRNILRRKGNSAIILFGLMVGTMIITSSFIIGDTMVNMIEHMILDSWDEVDHAIHFEELDNSWRLIDDDNYTQLREHILDINQKRNVIEGVTGELVMRTYVNNPETRLGDPTMTLQGVNVTHSPAMGLIYADGKALSYDLPLGDIYLNKMGAEKLDAKEGDLLNILIFPGIETPYGKNVFKVSRILDEKGRGSWRNRNTIFMPLEHVQKLFGTQGVNVIYITNVGDYDTGRKHSGYVSDQLTEILEDPVKNPLELQEQFNKKEQISMAKTGMEMFTKIFLVLGTFSIIAGVILIINIFVLLGEERKKEMGMARAIGMKRGALSKMFFYEGIIYCAISSLVGVFVGLGISAVIIRFISNLLQGVDVPFNLWQYFEFTLYSLVLAYLLGFVITGITVTLVTTRIARIDIVRAIRDIPDPAPSRKSKKILILGLIIISSGLLLILGTYLVDFIWDANEYSMLCSMSGVSLIIFGIAIMMRRYVGERLAFSLGSLIVLIQWFIPLEKLPFNPFPYPEELNIFVGAGFFMVTSSVIILMYNSNVILNILMRIITPIGHGVASVKTAISYPMKKRLRTGLTIFMFSLVIFTITTLSMVTGILSANITKMVEDQSAGIEIVGFIGEQNAIFRQENDINSVLERHPMVSQEDFNYIFTVSNNTGFMHFEELLNSTGEPEPTPLNETDIQNATDQEFDPLTEMLERGLIPAQVMGLDDEFLNDNEFGLVHKINRSWSNSSTWQNLSTMENTVIVDINLLATLSQFLFQTQGETDQENMSIDPNFISDMYGNLTEPDPEFVNLTQFLIGFNYSLSFDGINTQNFTIIGFCEPTGMPAIYMAQSRVDSMNRSTSLLDNLGIAGARTYFLFGYNDTGNLEAQNGLLEEDLGLNLVNSSHGVWTYAMPDNPYFSAVKTFWEVVEEGDRLEETDFKHVFAFVEGQTTVNVSKRWSQVHSDGDDQWVVEDMGVHGYNDDFMLNNKFKIKSYNKTRFGENAAGQEIWSALKNDPNLIILDSSEFRPPRENFQTGPPPDITYKPKVGTRLNITLPGENNYRIVEVAAIMDQEFFQGVYMHEDHVKEDFNKQMQTYFLLDLEDPGQGKEITKFLEADMGMFALNIQELVETIVETMNMFFNLFQSFLALGLIVGIAGLGIITMRAVHERRQEIGMMRAIGFKARSVMFSFFIEASFITIMGILIGTLLGLALGWNLWFTELRPEGWIFVIPWSRILFIAGSIYVITAIFTLPPSWKASKVEPAEALRYE